MKQFWSSKLGWCLASAYLAAAFFLFYEAKTCGVMLCDLAAWPAFFPFGALYYGMYEWLNQSYIFGRTVATFRDPWLIIPTVITNAGLYYFVGYAIGVGFGGRRLILGKLISLRAFLLLLLLGVVVPPLVWVLVTALR